MYSMTRNTFESCSPISKTLQMYGWSTAAAATASWAEAIARRTVAGSASRQNLDCDLAVKPGVERTIHNPHATSAGDRKDVEASEAGSRFKSQEFTVSGYCTCDGFN